MTLYLVLPILSLLAILQTTLIPLLAVGGIKPDFMLLTVVSWTLLRGTEEGMLWGFIGGLLLDLLSGGSLGITAMALICMSLLTGLGEVNLFRGHFLLPLAITPLFSLVYYMLMLTLFALFGRPLAWDQTLLRVMLPASILNLVFMPFVHSALARLHRRTGRPQIDW